MSKRPDQSDAASCYAVELVESQDPIDAADVPILPFFRELTLYATETVRRGGCRYSLRLGFFTDANTAEHVVRHVRRYFAAATVVAVEDTELDQADDLNPSPQITPEARVTTNIPPRQLN